MEEAIGGNLDCSEASAWAGETPLGGLLTREAAGEIGPLLAPMEPDLEPPGVRPAVCA